VSKKNVGGGGRGAMGSGSGGRGGSAPRGGGKPMGEPGLTIQRLQEVARRAYWRSVGGEPKKAGPAGVKELNAAAGKGGVKRTPSPVTTRVVKPERRKKRVSPLDAKGPVKLPKQKPARKPTEEARRKRMEEMPSRSSQQTEKDAYLKGETLGSRRRPKRS
jgi:hypothetical protein